MLRENNLKEGEDEYMIWIVMIFLLMNLCAIIIQKKVCKELT